MDVAWWKQYKEEAQASFKGKMIAPLTNIKGVEYWRFNHYKNSGAGAISLAVRLGAKKVILLGYDGQKTNGRAHWHEDHPKGMGNAGPVDKWVSQFKQLEQDFKEVEIINCSRETALHFKRQSLDEVIHGSCNS